MYKDKISVISLYSYTLWYRLACPQPEQPQLPSSTVCIEGPLIQVASTDQTQYTVTGSVTADPLPYSRYQFLVQAENSVGAVNTTSLSDPVETHASGEFIHIHQCLAIVLSCCHSIYYRPRSKGRCAVCLKPNHWCYKSKLGISIPFQWYCTALYPHSEWYCSPISTHNISFTIK